MTIPQYPPAINIWHHNGVYTLTHCQWAKTDGVWHYYYARVEGPALSAVTVVYLDGELAETWSSMGLETLHHVAELRLQLGSRWNQLRWWVLLRLTLVFGAKARP